MMFLLVDANSFYASAHSVFRPDLRGKPIIVLSNQDGCIVARSKEAKQLGIPDLVPFFKISGLIKKHRVHVFSSNYALYGDLSNRMNITLRRFAADVETYSIDEVFLKPLEHLYTQGNLSEYGSMLRNVVWKEVRLPVGVGAASTKSLSKLANKAAKKIEKLNGVCVIETEAQREWLLRRVPVNDIWGVGSRISAKLNQLGIVSGWDLATASPKRLRQHFSVCLERTVNELNGISCIDLEDVPPAKRQIYCTRSFNEKTASLDAISQSTSMYASRAAEKLRAQNRLVRALNVFLQTSAFDDNPIARSATIQLPYPTNDSRVIVSHALQCIRQIYKPGHLYSKSGVGLIDIVDEAFHQEDMFTPGQSEQSRALMDVVDSINKRFGRGAAFLAAAGVGKTFEMKQNYKSPHYLTSWTDLPVVTC